MRWFHVEPKPALGGVLIIEVDDIANAPVADPTNVSDWNSLFIVPVLGTPFSSVSVTGNVITLFNTGTIVLNSDLFGVNLDPVTWLIRFIDSDIITDISATASRRQFANQAALVDIKLPVIQRLGASMFIACTSLTSVFFPEVVQTIRTTSGQPFTNCTSLVFADLPKCVSLGIGTFSGCTSLASVNFPVLEIIGAQAFQNCPALSSPHFPEVIQIDNQAFFLGTNNATMTHFSAPKCTTISGNRVFQRRTGLININLPVCTQIGATTANNLCFVFIGGNTIEFTLPVATRSDGDVVALASENTVTFLP